MKSRIVISISLIYVLWSVRTAIPQSLDDVKQTLVTLEEYNVEYFWYVWTGFVTVYLLMQSFGIPGTLFLSILSGALFGTSIGFCTVAFTSSTGASLCYLLSSRFAKTYLEHRFEGMLTTFRKSIQSNRNNLFYYLLFLRMTPFMPNWFINIASPVMGIPFLSFYFATLFGLMPANYIHVSTGVAIHSFQAGESVMGWQTIVTLSCAGVLSLFPILYKRMKSRS